MSTPFAEVKLLSEVNVPNSISGTHRGDCLAVDEFQAAGASAARIRLDFLTTTRLKRDTDRMHRRNATAS